jgi:hypothetical protein
MLRSFTKVNSQSHTYLDDTPLEDRPGVLSRTYQALYKVWSVVGEGIVCGTDND